MDDLTLLHVLHAWNPEWTGRPSRPLPEFHRDALTPLLEGLNERKIVVLAGPRQTGKTTLLRQAAEAQRHRSARPEVVLSLPLDELADDLVRRTVTLRRIVELYAAEIVKAPLGRQDVTLLLDEVQMFPGWARAVKALHDQGLPLRIAVSGSASAQVEAAAAQALAGRMMHLEIHPMTCWERLRATGDEAAALAGDRTALREAMTVFIQEGGAAALRTAVETARRALVPHEAGLQTAFASYLEAGGYPEVVVRGWTLAQAADHLRTFLALMIHKDFVEFFHLRDTRSFERLVRILAQETGHILVERALARDLGVAVNTLRNHLGFLEDTRVVWPVRAFVRSHARASRLPEKFFFLDPGLRNALAGWTLHDRGAVTETAAFLHLARLAHTWPGAGIRHWRHRNDEVDLVIQVGHRATPVEVRAGHAGDLRGMSRFLELGLAREGLLIGPEASPDPRLVAIPAPLFCLLA